jgi:hypothetical protein
MSTELEASVVALEAVLQAGSGEEAKRLGAIYQSRLDDELSRHPGVAREKLMGAVDFAHAKWLRAQRQPPTLPPKA